MTEIWPVAGPPRRTDTAVGAVSVATPKRLAGTGLNGSGTH